MPSKRNVILFLLIFVIGIIIITIYKVSDGINEDNGFFNFLDKNPLK